MPPVSAVAQSDWAVLQVTQKQLHLTQEMTQATILIALGVDKAESAEALRRDRDAFDQLLQLLRDGDRSLKLAPLTDRQLLIQLKEVERLWGSFNAQIEPGMAAGGFERAGLEEIMRWETSLVMALRQFAQAYRSAVPELRVHSLHLNTRAVVVKQPLLARFMLKDFLLIAYEHDVSKTRLALTKSYSQLDRSFQALLYGDSELQIIPAPTPEIEAQIEMAQSHWRSFESIIKAAAKGKTISKEQVTEVTNRYRTMLAAIEETITMY